MLAVRKKKHLLQLLLPLLLLLLPLLLSLKPSKTLALPVLLLPLLPLLAQLPLLLALLTLLLLLLPSNSIYLTSKKATVRWLFYVCNILRSSGYCFQISYWISSAITLTMRWALGDVSGEPLASSTETVVTLPWLRTAI